LAGSRLDGIELKLDFPAELGTEANGNSQKPKADWKKDEWKRMEERLANLWSRKKITKKARAGRGHESKREMSNEFERSANETDPSNPQP